MKRDKLIQLRVNEHEYQFIMLKMQERKFKSLSDYLRTCSITPNHIIKNQMNSMIYEVNKIGVNLNQLTRKVNMNKGFDYELLHELKLINLSLDATLSIYKALIQ